MLTDSGTNAMSDQQIASMMVATTRMPARPASRGCRRRSRRLRMTHVLPVPRATRRGEHHLQDLHQGRRRDPDELSFHDDQGAHRREWRPRLEIVFTDEALKIRSSHPSQGNLDIKKLEAIIAEVGPARIPYVRMEASTNLIAGSRSRCKTCATVRAVTRNTASCSCST